MRLKQRDQPAAPGLVGAARVDRRTTALLPRLRPGDIAVVDHLDLDRETARALIEAGVAGVVNLNRFVSGRYPARGAQTLLEANVVLVEQVSPAAAARIKDGSRVRLHEGTVYADDELLADGVAVSTESVASQMAQAREAMPTQLASLTHNAVELLRREEALLLHGEGLPRVSATFAGRPVLAAGAGPELDAELADIRLWVRQNPVTVVAVGAAAHRVHKALGRIDVLLLGPGDVDLVPAKLLRAARDVIRVGTVSTSESESLGRLGVRAQAMATSLAPFEAALLLAAGKKASVVVTAGRHADVASLLDRGDAGTSTLLGRLAAGDRLVDARTLSLLWSGRVRSWHVWLVLVAGLLAVAAAVAVTPVGQDWWHEQVAPLFESLRGSN